MTSNLLKPSLEELLDNASDKAVSLTIDSFDFDISGDDLYMVGDAYIDEEGCKT
jgi:hypothetical protein